jgi:hypothetical protein
MAKRFTDTDKWKDPWFKKLPGKCKLFWLFVLDTCDHAGIWKDQIDDFTYLTGFDFSKQDLDYFSDRMFTLSSDAYIVPKFIKFQYPNFNPDKNNAHKGVIKSLNYYGLETDDVYKLLISSRNYAPREGLGRFTGIGIGTGLGLGLGLGLGTGTGTERGLIENINPEDFFKGIGE